MVFGSSRTETVDAGNKLEALKGYVNTFLEKNRGKEIHKFVTRQNSLKIKMNDGSKLIVNNVDTKAFAQWWDQRGRDVFKDTRTDLVLEKLQAAFGPGSEILSEFKKENENNVRQAAFEATETIFKTRKNLVEIHNKVEDRLLQLKDGQYFITTPLGGEIAVSKQGKRIIYSYSDGQQYLISADPAIVENDENISNISNGNSIHSGSLNKGDNSQGGDNTQAVEIVTKNTLAGLNNDGENKVSVTPVQPNADNILAKGTVAPTEKGQPKNEAKDEVDEIAKEALKVKDVSIEKNQRRKYEYQSIYKLTNSKLKNPDTMTTREIIRELFQGDDENFIDIIEVRGSHNARTVPGSQEKELLRQFFKKPLKGLVMTRDVQLDDLWKALEKVVATNGDQLHGLSGVEKNKEFFQNNQVNLSTTKTGWLNRLFIGSDQEKIANDMAHLTSLYVQYKRNPSVLGAYTQRLFAMLDNGNQYGFAKDSLKSVIKANQDNVGTLAGVDLLDAHKATIKEAYAKLGGRGRLPDFLRDKALTQAEVKALLQINLAGGDIPTSDTTTKTLINRFSGLSDLLTPNAYGKSEMMLLEAKALGANPGAVANIVEIATNAKIDEEKYGKISDATVLMNFVVDYNANGKGGDAADFGKFSGAQLLTNYRLAVNEYMMNHDIPEANVAQAEEHVMQSVLNAVRASAKNVGDTYFANILANYSTMNSWKDMVKKHPAIVVYIQNYMKNYAGEPYMLFSANEQGSVKEYYEEVTVGAQESVTATVDQQLAQLEGLSAEEKAKLKAAVEEKAKEFLAEYTKQSQTLTPSEKEYFAKMVSLESLQQNILHTMLSALKAQPSFGNNWAVGLGTALALTKNMQLNIGTGLSGGRLVPGIGLGWHADNNKFGANVGVNVLGASAGLFARLAEWDNSKKMSNTLEPITKKEYALTASASAGVGLNNKLAYVGGGIGLSVEQDKKAGIDMIARNAEIVAKDLLKNMFNDAEGNLAFDSFAKGQGSENLKNYLKKALRNKFPKTQSDILDQSVYNIITSIDQVKHELNRDKMIVQIASSMAQKWRDAQLTALAGKYELSKLALGAGIFLSPVDLTGALGLTFAAKLSRYSVGAGAVNSQEEYRRQARHEGLGLSNRHMKVSNDKFVSYLNRTIQASRGMVDMTQKEQISKFGLSEDGKFIVVPAQLWRDDKNLTIKVAQGSKDKIAYDDNDNLYVSVGEDIRLSVSADQNAATYVLNIGALTTSQNDILLTRNREENVEMLLTMEQKDTIVHRARQVKNLHELAGKELQNILGEKASNFALGSDGKTISYDDNSNNGHPMKKVLKAGDTVGDWTFEVNNGALLFKNKNDNQETQLPLNYTFDGFGQVLTALGNTTTQKAIEQWENKNPDKVKNFYSKVIEGAYTEALKTLTDGGLWSQDALAAIKSVIENKEGTSAQQNLYAGELAVYMTQIFALEPGYNGQNLTALFAKRKAIFEGLDQSVTSFLSRKDFENAYSNDMALTPGKGDVKDNLIGYTAFYRKGKGGHRGYGMTLPGYTNVLAGKVNNFTDADNAASAKTWLLEKIKTDNFAKKAIEKAFVEKLNISEVQAMSPEQITDLLSGKSVTLADTEVSIEATPVFYLLAECANESIGLQITGITKTKGGKTVELKTDFRTESIDGNRVVGVNNLGANMTLGKKTIFNVAIGVSGKIDGKGGEDGEEAPKNIGGTDPTGEGNPGEGPKQVGGTDALA